MRISKEQLAAEKENFLRRESGKWFSTGWYRLLDADGDLQVETSNRREVERFLAEEQGWTAQRLMEKHKRKWVEL